MPGPEEERGEKSSVPLTVTRLDELISPKSRNSSVVSEAIAISPVCVVTLAKTVVPDPDNVNGPAPLIRPN